MQYIIANVYVSHHEIGTVKLNLVLVSLRVIFETGSDIYIFLLKKKYIDTKFYNHSKLQIFRVTSDDARRINKFDLILEALNLT